MFMKTIKLLLLTLLLLSKAIASDQTSVSLSEDGQLIYDGKLSADANEALYSLYESTEPKPTVLRITSTGGNVHLGLDVGEWVHRHSLDVEILRGCASSCANYIFTAGHRKMLHPDSGLYWHGSSMSEGVEKEVKKGRVTQGYLDTWQAREKAFYEMIGVNPRIATYGESVAFGLLRRYDGWDYSIEDMKKFGVDNVHEIGGQWDWHRHKPQFKVKRVKVDLAKLKE